MRPGVCWFMTKSNHLSYSLPMEVNKGQRLLNGSWYSIKTSPRRQCCGLYGWSAVFPDNDIEYDEFIST